VTYYVYFNLRKIVRIENKNINQASEEAMIEKGGKKIGTDKVLGYNCDVWQIGKFKKCIYKGVPLKVESNIIGIKKIEIATRVAFNTVLSSDLKLPRLPIYDLKRKRIDRSKLDAMDKESFERLNRDTGAKNEHNTTKNAEAKKEILMDIYLNLSLPDIKKKILKSIKTMSFSKECFENAYTLKDARVCESKVSEMVELTTKPKDKLLRWDARIKKELLKVINRRLKELKCAEKTNTIQEIRKCIPHRHKNIL